MNAKQLILERRTVRQYTDQPVPEELVLELLDIAVYAPNHKLREPWRFVLAIDEGRERYIAELLQLLERSGKFDGKTPEQRKALECQFTAVPVYLTVLCQTIGTEAQQTEDLLATAALIQNLQLLAADIGLGVCWKTGKHWYTEEYEQLVGASETERVVGVLQLGWPEVVPPVKKRKSARNKLTHF